jgi:hypothetical protein
MVARNGTPWHETFNQGVQGSRPGALTKQIKGLALISSPHVSQISQLGSAWEAGVLDVVPKGMFKLPRPNRRSAQCLA